MSGVLVDTSVWIKHFRRADTVLSELLLADAVLSHPLVLLELAERLGVAYKPSPH